MAFSSSIDRDDLPKISVIIVTLNIVDLLQRCLDSIYKQGYPLLEIIVIDGASNDGTIEVLEENSSKITFWKSEPDNGIYDAMNKGIDHITGDWVYFIGADDVLFDDFSKLLCQLIDSKAIYYGRVLINGKKTQGNISAYEIAKRNICHQAIIYPVSVFKKYKYCIKYPINADHLLNMQCWNDKDLHFKFVDFIIANFNHTGISSLKTDFRFQKDKSSLIYENHELLIWLRYIFRKFKMMLNPGKYQNSSHSD